MSTMLYLICLDHSAESENEVGRNLSDLNRVREMISNRDKIPPMYEALRAFDITMGADSWQRAAIYFLEEHQTCALMIRDEYGKFHPIVEPEDERKARQLNMLYEARRFLAALSVRVPDEKQIEAFLLHTKNCWDNTKN